MTIKTVLLGCVVAAACGKGQNAADKSEAKTNEAPAPTTKTTDQPAGNQAPDPACATKVKELEPWLAQLELETASHEIDFGYKLQPIDRTPFPVDKFTDLVQITPTAIDAFDVSEPDRAKTNLGKNPAQKAVVERLTKIRSMAANKPDAAPDDRIRIDVDQGAAWGDVARVVDAATKAGYTHALFVFTATSKLTPPAGAEPATTSHDVQKAASTRLEELQKTCKPWRSAILNHAYKTPPSENAKAVASETAAALVACNCAVDLDEVKKLLWQDQRWHQAVRRVGITIQLTGDGAKTIALPAKTAWSDAHPKLVELAPEGAPPPVVKLAAK